MGMSVVVLREDLGWGCLAGGHGDNIGNVHDVVVGDHVALVRDSDGTGGEGREGESGAHFRRMLLVGCGLILLSLLRGSQIRLTVYA